MPYAGWAMYLWPGLPELWWRGSRSGLSLAMTFGLLANLVVAATWVWPELPGARLGGTLWAGLGVVWIALVVVSIRVAIRSDESLAAGETDIFSVAQTEYLKGNWLEAEILARRLLAERPADAEAALLLTSTLRRAGRVDEARAALDEMQLWDRSAAWRHEIDVEYQRLADKELQLAEQGNLEQEVQQGDAATLPLPNLRDAA